MLKKDKFCINSREFSSENVLIIAELGTSHGADIIKAGDLIDAAAESGADCIKFQIVYAQEILHPKTGEVQLPGGNIRLFDRFKDLECSPDFYEKLKEKVEKKGLIFLCTPFGINSARELKALKPECIKIASPELNYTALLEEVSGYNLPVLLSSGVSLLSDIEAALSILGNMNTCLLHCVTSYPAPESDYNLSLLKNLSGIFGIPAGISDHSLDPELVPALAVSQGAVAIEKHFALSRKDSGLDDPIALIPSDFAKMTKAIRKAEKAGPEECLEFYYSERGKELVNSILGDGIKKLSPSERANYQRTNRSIHALREIKKGELIYSDMIRSLRTEKILRPGLPPIWEKKIIGRRAIQDIPDGEGIRFEDIG